MILTPQRHLPPHLPLQQQQQLLPQLQLPHLRLQARQQQRLRLLPHQLLLGHDQLVFKLVKIQLVTDSVSDISVSKLSVSSFQVSDDTSWFWPYD